MCAKFGWPVSLDQATDRRVMDRIREIVLRALREGSARRISGVLWFFEGGVLFPAPGRGIVDSETDPHGPAWVVVPVHNPDAAVPLPENL